MGYIAVEYSHSHHIYVGGLDGPIFPSDQGYKMKGSYSTLTINGGSCRHYQLYLRDRDKELFDVNLDWNWNKFGGWFSSGLEINRDAWDVSAYEQILFES